DGIRDFHVTGVQTCALPICNFSVTEQYLFYLTQDAQLRVLNKFTGELVGKVNFSNSLFLLGDDIAEYYFEVAADSNYVALFFARSEERRVGKECRCRWSP